MDGHVVSQLALMTMWVDLHHSELMIFVADQHGGMIDGGSKSSLLHICVHHDFYLNCIEVDLH